MMKTKNFRRRADDGDDDDDEGSTGLAKPQQQQQSAKSGNSKKPNKPSIATAKPSAPKLLSFAEDEDNVDVGGNFKAASKKAPKLPPVSFGRDEDLFSTKQKKKNSGFGALPGSVNKLSAGKEKGASIPSNFQPQAGEYTKEKLIELQKKTIRLGGAKPPVENKSSEPVVILKGLVKPSMNFANTKNNDAQPVMDMDFDPIHPKIEKGIGSVATKDRLKSESEEAESRLGLMGIGPGAESGGVTHIPDAAAIAAAKAKRERLRQAQAAPDYIPLGKVDAADLRGKSSSVQDKEDQYSSEDEPENQVRIAMLAELPSDSNRGGVFESVEEKLEDRILADQRDEEEEDEERRWEEQQLRKGFGKRVDDSTTQPASAHMPPLQDGTHLTGYFANGLAALPLPSSAWGFTGQTMDAMTITQKADAALNTLHDTLQRAKEQHKWTLSELRRTEENLSTSIIAIDTLNTNFALADKKYKYMQEMQCYIADLCDFLKSKGPLIEQLEEHMQKLHEDRANALLNRRVADSADEMLEVEPAVNAAIAALNKGASIASTSNAMAAAQSSSNTTPDLDEFGRDLNLQKRMEAKQRAEGRERRRARSAKRKAAMNREATIARIEGESSSDESESEEKAFESGRAEILDTAGRVFADASEQYSELAVVKGKLEMWKRLYYTSYRDAYVSLSIPTLFAPYVRLELLKWDPLYGNNDFDNMNWYTLLFDYGMPEKGKDLYPEDPDINLVPKLVENVALPILHHGIDRCWDILSSKSTKNAVAAVQLVLLYVPPTSEALQDLLSVVRRHLAEAVAKLEVPTWSTEVMNAVPKAARLAAYRFGTSVRLLKNVALWKDVLATPLLERLALDELLCGKMLPHLRSLLQTPYDAVSRTERVISALSGVWTGPNFTNSSKLDPLVEYVMSIGRTIEKRKGDDVVGLARRIKRMLVELNEYDRARLLSKTFQLKEAL